MKVAWQGGMTFNGATATFKETVVAETKAEQLRTEQLEVDVGPRIDFQRIDNKARPDVVEIRCRDGVWGQHRRLEAGRQTTLAAVEGRRLRYNRVSGDVELTGPGWFTYMGYGGSFDLPNAAPGASVAPKIEKDQLSFLRIEFQTRHEATNSAATSLAANWCTPVYGPVENWGRRLETRPANGPQATNCCYPRGN